MKKVDGDILKKLVEYHEFHGDTDARCIRVFKASRGVEYYLMRFNDEHGSKYSSIDTIFCGKDESYVSEFFSARRENEKKMIERAIAFFNEEDEHE